MADFSEFEARDGVRFSWNLWPNSRIEATKCVVPFAALYTPNKVIENMPVVPYEPVRCKSCGSILNPFANTDFSGGIWTCPFCLQRNHFPAHYRGITPELMPAELYAECCTIEYQLPATKAVLAPAYVFVLDTCCAEDELTAARAAITQALATLPEYAQVGLVTFGTHVHVHELGFSECTKAYVFKGSREYTPPQIADQLGLGPKAAPRKGPPGATGQPAPPRPPGTRFILPLQECEFAISGALEELQRDAFPAVAENRPARCTGTALMVAASLMGATLVPGSCAARLMLFVGGPSTEGPGKVVDKELSEPIRSHKDLAKDSAAHFKKARKFFDALASQLVTQSHSLDIFSCALDQVGLAEMKMAVEATGGMVVQTDTFHNPVFKESLRRVFAHQGEDGFLATSSNATLEVIPSRGVKVAGLLGPAAASEKKGPSVADQMIGIGGTTLWKLAGLDASTTLALFFEIVAGAGGDGRGGPQQEQFFLQFVTKYLHFDGTFHQRVTTVMRKFVDGSSPQDLLMGFDQEAAAVVLARLASFKMETEEEFDATRWLDRMLIRLASRFGDFRKDDPGSFQFAPNMSFYPQFVFNLRRSQFVQVFGNSPDETAYVRLALNRETVTDAIVMIQPVLQAYTINQEGPEPVLLDVQSIAPERILVLDSYFYVVVFHGTTVAQWRRAEYHLQPEHAAFKALLEMPKADASEILKKRFPVPRLVDCDQNGSQARFLLAKLNPSSTYNSQQALSAEVIMTDDVSLSVFTEHLKKLAVQS